MATETQPAVGSAIQHPLVGVASTPLTLGPLRRESTENVANPPCSGVKMVSLADLHVHTSARNIPPYRTVGTEAIDPTDPVLHYLVQDTTFIEAVQTGQIQSAALAALRVFKAYAMPENAEFKRPLDRHPYHDLTPHGNVLLHNANGHHTPYHHSVGSPTQSPAGNVRSMKQEVLQLEEAIPWTMVRRNWRNKRTTWRRQVKQTELVSEFAVRLKELRLALLAEDYNFVGCGPAWRSHLESCIQGRGTAASLIAVWDEMKQTIRVWLSSSNGGRGQQANGHHASGSGYNGFISSTGPAPGAASTGRAVLALQHALKDTKSDDTSALLQTPLESIMGHDGCSLHAVRQAIEMERRILASRLAALKNAQGDSMVPSSPPPTDHNGKPLSSYFASISAAWEDSDFDSGADTAMDDGSDATDLDSDFDS